MERPLVVLLSSPGLGHLFPLLELGKRLATVHSFHVTIFVVAARSSPVETEVLRSSRAIKLCDIVELPPVDISGKVDADAAVVTQICVMMRELRPALRSCISALKSKPAALIVDLFGTESFVIAEELEIPRFVYVATGAWFVAVSVYAPTLDGEVEGEFEERKELVEIPGCKSVRAEDLPDPMLDRLDQQYREYLRMGGEMASGDGILINTWQDLQPEILAGLGRMVKTRIFPVGPLVRPDRAKAGLKGEWWLNWLEKQPKESVVYVSLGSGGTLSCKQMEELAWGLELSQQRFIWVVRPPTITAGDGSFFTVGEGGGDDMSRYFPDGFLTRTKNRGVVVPQWAPQVDILSHTSTGAFLTHCGWNSTLESIVHGVPMIAWPLYAEQRLNATMLTQEIGVAVRPKTLPTKAVVGRKEIKNMITKLLMAQGTKTLRNRIKELRTSAEKALAMGGSSYNALEMLAKECRKGWNDLVA